MAEDHTKQMNNTPLFCAYQALHTFYAKNNSQLAPQKLEQKTLQCMIALLECLDKKIFTNAEIVGICAAKAYWFNHGQELVSIIVQLNQMVQSQITYANPAVDDRLACVCEVLSLDSDHFDELLDFLENIVHAGLSENTIIQTMKQIFSEVDFN